MGGQSFAYKTETQACLASGQSVAAATTTSFTPGTAPDNVINVFEAVKADIRCIFTGVSGGSGNVTYSFVGIGAPGEAWPTIASFTSGTIAQNGAATVIKDFVQDVSAYYQIALLSIQNVDATHAISAAMAVVDYKV